jgi:hypothetical protein
LSWDKVEALCVAAYAGQDGQHELYLVKAGPTRLAWEWSAAAAPEERAASELLLRLVATRTQLPLRELLPGIATLSLALRGALLWARTRAELSPLNNITQPEIPGVPLAAIRTWERKFLVLGIAFNAPIFTLGLLLRILG